MMKNWIMKAAAFLCALMLIAVALVGPGEIAGFLGLPFAHAEAYTAGDAEISEPVKNLDIDWTSGAVTIAYHNQNTVLIQEKANKTISESRKMQWWLDGGTLRIRFEKPGLHLHWDFSKELTVTLPEGLALDDVYIGATSGTLRIPALQAQNLKLDVTSGGIYATADAQQVSADATSGSIELHLQGETQSIVADSSSGDILVEAENAGKVKLGSTSGTIRAAIKTADTVSVDSTSGDIQSLIGFARKVNIDSTSGNVQIKIASFGALRIDTTSGNIQAGLKQTPGFTAKFSTTSGDVSCQLPLIKQDGAYICGDGSASVSMDSTSGDITVLALSD